jgi:hypothetical protein
MLLAPVTNLDAETLSVAVATPPTSANVPVPSAMFPNENVTVPPGAPFPVTAATVAVSCAVPNAAILAGAAVTVVLVATGGPVIVTMVETVEVLKLPVGV